ncbi:hypothetical protein E2562_026633 [Oryza meyeriana var. granulata]|uniref:Protein SCAR n=1 Tax=Oryza meyeriana var. granulata TaxID=110450 RepID=A0A6G1D719_9ORYZ|nr:hypothetical protein E2562_026633 [Oryza meyeriana var. granulata]
MSKSKCEEDLRMGSREFQCGGAVLEVEVEVEGFVAILRHLGDLAQLAAEVFQGMHDQAMAVSARARQLALRLDHLDAASSSTKLSQDYSSFCREHHCLFLASNIDRVHWRANLMLKRGIVGVAGGNNKMLPSFIFERFQRCRGPPKLSLLDKYDADGEGACLKRYTNPSFFKSASACSTNQMAKAPPNKETKPTFQCSDSDNSNPPKASQCGDSVPEIDASQGFLTVYRQLKYRQANGSLMPQMHNFQNDATPEVSISSNRSTESSIKVTEDITLGTDSVSEERSCELERTSSFEAWLSPNAHILQHDQVAEEMSHYTCNNRFVSHVTPNDAIAATKRDYCKEHSSTYKKAVSKRSKYKGGMEFITARVSSFPRKLFTKKQDPQPLSVADSFRNMTSKILELKCNNVRDNDSNDMGPNNREDHDGKRLEMTRAVNVASPSFQEELLAGVSDEPSSPEALFHVSAEHRYMHATKASFEGVPALAEVASDQKRTECTQEQSDDACEASYDTLLDEEELHQSVVHPERNVSSVPKPSSTRSIAQEECEGPRKDMVPPLPPMQWLSSVKVHSGSKVASPKLRTPRPQSPAVNRSAGSNYVHPVKEQLETDIIQARSHYSILASHTEIAQTPASDVKSAANRDGIRRDGFAEKDSEEKHHQEKGVVKPSEGEVLKTMKVGEPTVNSDEARPEHAEIKPDSHAETQSPREEKHQISNGDSDCNKHDLRLSTEKRSESCEDLYRMGKEISATHINASQVDVQNSLDHPTDEERNTNVHAESVFFSAVEQLTKMNPPPVPRPKYSLLQVRTPPGLIYPSRKLSGDISKLPEPINAKSYDLKPALGRGSNVVDHSNTKVATILQRVDHIRQAQADNCDVDSEVSWSDSD